MKCAPWFGVLLVLVGVGKGTIVSETHFPLLVLVGFGL